MGSKLSDAGESRFSRRTSDRGVERLLIDECLSQGLLAVAKERGTHADHVVWLGKSGTQDWNLSCRSRSITTTPSSPTTGATS
jgi:hypothetical protein